MNDARYRATRICCQLLIAGFVLLFVLPLFVNGAFRWFDDAGIFLLSGLIVGLPAAMVTILAFRTGHWFDRMCWLVVGASAGACILGLGLVCSGEGWESEVVVQAAIGTILSGALLILLRRMAKRFSPLLIALPEEEQVAAERLSLMKLFVGTTILALLMAAFRLVTGHDSFPSGPGPSGFLFGLTMSTLIILATCFNSIVCVYWSFASRDLVLLFPIFAPIYAVAVSYPEVILLSLLAPDTEPLRLGMFASLFTLCQISVVMVCLLYLRCRGFRLASMAVRAREGTETK